MALATFYHPELEENESAANLSAGEAAHAIKSRRLKQGSAIQLINGRGLVAQADIIDVSNQQVKVHINSIEIAPKPTSVRIASAVPKGDRQRSMIDMLTQLGVDEIIPLRCEHSVAQFKIATQEKWQRLSVAACKQAQNPWLPIISQELSVEKVLQKVQSPIFYADKDGTWFESLQDRIAEGITILIGPEGGFSESEIANLAKSATPVSLAPNILRTELAAITAAAQARIFMK
ncbi:MAG: 16S rRNA (uracil(1498)-N(3))-methyltransferase [Acidiferrobacterales bacterium]|nr:16S rRNA (uracil(1498)-N(3))-methyltransferase [Acidiferrobacterales bacterium]